MQRGQAVDEFARIQHLDEMKRHLRGPRLSGGTDLPRTKDDAPDDGNRRRDIERECYVHATAPFCRISTNRDGIRKYCRRKGDDHLRCLFDRRWSMKRSRIRSLARASTALLAMALSQGASAQDATPAKETPLSMVNALHTAFGDHHARAVHTKGIIFEGTFTPDKGARAIVKEPIFAGGTLPVIARFSLFAGVPDLPDNDDGASPTGFAVKIKAVDGDDFDIESNQHRDFITATFDEFAVFLRAVGATKPDTPHPNPVEQFLAAHPHAKEFLGSRTYPTSFAKATYWGINAVKFTNARGKSVFARYRFKPQ